MDKTLIEKLKEVIQQHSDLTGERVYSFHVDWEELIDGSSIVEKVNVNHYSLQIVKVNVNIEK